MPRHNEILRILIIDDSVEMIRMLSSILKEQAEICFATNGEDGIIIAKELQPQVIILDIEMIGIDGYEVCRRLKEDPETTWISVIFVTAHNGMESEIQALNSGAVDFITKPLNPAVVQARVRTHLSLQIQSAALIQLSEHDALTGLYNRRYFDKVLEVEIQRHQRHGFSIGIAFIDIDCFKNFNDCYGHQAGDQCLTSVANAILASTLRPSEIVARYGGEEFVVILPYCSLEQVHQYGDRVCSRVVDLEIPPAG